MTLLLKEHWNLLLGMKRLQVLLLEFQLVMKVCEVTLLLKVLH